MLKRYIGDRSFYKWVLAIAIPIVIQNGITNFGSPFSHSTSWVLLPSPLPTNCRHMTLHIVSMPLMYLPWYAPLTAILQMPWKRLQRSAPI